MFSRLTSTIANLYSLKPGDVSTTLDKTGERGGGNIAWRMRFRN